MELIFFTLIFTYGAFAEQQFAGGCSNPIGYCNPTIKEFDLYQDDSDDIFFYSPQSIGQNAHTVYSDPKRNILVYEYPFVEYSSLKRSILVFDLIRNTRKKIGDSLIYPGDIFGSMFYDDGYAYYFNDQMAFSRLNIETETIETMSEKYDSCINPELNEYDPRFSFVRTSNAILILPLIFNKTACYMNYTSTNGNFDDFSSGKVKLQYLPYAATSTLSITGGLYSSAVYHAVNEPLEEYSIFRAIDNGKYKTLNNNGAITSGNPISTSIMVDKDTIYYGTGDTNFPIYKYTISKNTWEKRETDNLFGITGLSYDSARDTIYFFGKLDDIYDDQFELNFFDKSTGIFPPIVPPRVRAIQDDPRRCFPPLSIVISDDIRNGFYVEPYYYVISFIKLFRIQCHSGDDKQPEDDPIIIPSIYKGTMCGDGYTEIPQEQCDDANTNDEDGCSNCEITPGWNCNNYYFDYIHSASVCRRNLIGCGNLRVDDILGEECDDGNRESGDGCSENCKLECGYVCSTNDYGNFNGCKKSTRIAVCGDGVKDFDEVCDDGDTNDDDGCSFDCQILEPGWKCTLIDCLTKCVDIDECKAMDNPKAIFKPCAARASCLNTQGSFLCECNLPFTGDGYTTCNQPDHCSGGVESTCPRPNDVCLNEKLDFICNSPCPKGLFLNNADECVDFDECFLANSLKPLPPNFICPGKDCLLCDSNSLCVNTIGSFSCMCKTGFVGDGYICSALDCTNREEGTRCIKSDYSAGTCKPITLGEGTIMSCEDCLLETDADCEVPPYSGILNKETCSCETVAATVCGSPGAFCTSSSCTCCKGLVLDNGRCQFPSCKKATEKCTLFSNGTSNCCFGTAPVSSVCQTPTLERSCTILGGSPTTAVPCCQGLKSTSGICQRNTLAQCSITSIPNCCFQKAKNTCTCYCPTVYYKNT